MNEFDRTVLDSLPQGVGMTDLEGRFVYTSPRFESLFGYEPGELLGQPGFVLNAPSDEDPAVLSQKIAESIELRGSWEGEVHCKKKDGTLFWTQAKLTTFTHPEMGTLWIGIQEDISEKKSIELQLLQAQKMEAMGVMAGGIAHEFNNLLAVIQGNLELIMMDEESARPISDGLGDILGATGRAVDLVKQVLLFARKESAERQRLEPQSIVKQAQTLAAATRSNAKLILDLTEECCAVHANPTQLHQVCLNLINNAVQSLPDAGGMVWISGQRILPEDLPESVNHLSLLRADYVFRLQVKDSGSGIAPENVSRIFEPFFTTKKAGKGTGLGLSVVATIIAHHEGEITVESKLGKGTEFCVYLPAFDESTPSADIELVRPNTAEHERVLVVEDQAGLATIYSEFLTDAGYKVTVCTSGQEALHRFAAAPDSFDLICTDLEMPGVSGKDLVSKVRSSASKVPIILVSGFLAPEVQEELTQLGVDMFLPKPVRLPELHAGVQSCLDARWR